MPSAEDVVKAAVSDAFKRACATFGIVATPDDDETAPPTPARPRTNPRAQSKPTATTSQVDLRDIGPNQDGGTPRKQIDFPDARTFYRWAKANSYLTMVDDIRVAHSFPDRILAWTPVQIATATAEILERGV
jgi:hypothetical protein